VPEAAGGGGLETTSGAREEATARGGGGAASARARREAGPARIRQGLAPAEEDEDGEKVRTHGAASISSGDLSSKWSGQGGRGDSKGIRLLGRFACGNNRWAEIPPSWAVVRHRLPRTERPLALGLEETDAVGTDRSKTDPARSKTGGTYGNTSASLAAPAALGVWSVTR